MSVSVAKGASDGGVPPQEAPREKANRGSRSSPEATLCWEGACPPPQTGASVQTCLPEGAPRSTAAPGTRDGALGCTQLPGKHARFHRSHPRSPRRPPSPRLPPQVASRRRPLRRVVTQTPESRSWPCLLPPTPQGDFLQPPYRLTRVT